MEAKAWLDVGLWGEEIEEAEVAVEATLLSAAATFKGDPIVATKLLDEDFVGCDELSWPVGLADELGACATNEAGWDGDVLTAWEFDAT